MTTPSCRRSGRERRAPSPPASVGVGPLRATRRRTVVAMSWRRRRGRRGGTAAGAGQRASGRTPRQDGPLSQGIVGLFPVVPVLIVHRPPFGSAGLHRRRQRCRLFGGVGP